MSNISNEQLISKKPSSKDSKYIKELLKNNFGHEVSYSKTENTLYFTKNELLLHPEILKILKDFRVFIQISLF